MFYTLAQLNDLYRHYPNGSRLSMIRDGMRRNMDAKNGPRWRVPIGFRDQIPAILAKLKKCGKKLGQIAEDGPEDVVAEILEDLQDTPVWTRRTWERVESSFSFVFISRCSRCGSVHHEDSMTHSEYHDEYFCSACDNEYVYSHLMESHIQVSRAQRYYETARAYRNSNHDYVVPGCDESDDLYQYDGDYFSEAAYYDLGFADSDDDDDDDDNDCIIQDYHSSRHSVGHMPSAFDNRTPRVLLGLELEMEVYDGYSRDNWASKVLSTLNKEFRNYCGAERDGSLDHGFEIVTGWTGLDTHARVLSALGTKVEEFKGILSSHDTSTCGLHVHVDKADMTPFHASKMVAFIHDPLNKNLIASVARRYKTVGGDGGYAKFDHGKDKAKDGGKRALRRQKDYKRSGYDAEESRLRSLVALNEDRYEALNFHNPNTVEFRLFRGTLKYETIMACLEFAYATWFFCRDTGMGDLTDESFCRFLARPDNRADTKFLRRYLKLRKHQPMLDADPTTDKYQEMGTCESEAVEKSKATAEVAAAAMQARAQARAQMEREALERLAAAEAARVAEEKRRAEREAALKRDREEWARIEEEYHARHQALAESAEACAEAVTEPVAEQLAATVASEGVIQNRSGMVRTVLESRFPSSTAMWSNRRLGWPFMDTYTSSVRQPDMQPVYLDVTRVEDGTVQRELVQWAPVQDGAAFDLEAISFPLSM